ncbi:hypothetical protein K443DRAFT_675020 [Laccaria amethystina LaAM-08-1]|uniref:Unplaced genomic scaffold K443scaffold_24, whole genome shotgun sequence n=1 Tax=Laccaria amethystina LaAM-08-1 TaxID=1095629 RepID=A0A0C9X056_9AGAR|nr:hypothetical protein K443DRAFT_675020 [Laccaria amethystina LaAM-08-1]
MRNGGEEKSPLSRVGLTKQQMVNDRFSEWWHCLEVLLYFSKPNMPRWEPVKF